MRPFTTQATDNECVSVLKVAWIGYKMAAFVRLLDHDFSKIFRIHLIADGFTHRGNRLPYWHIGNKGSTAYSAGRFNQIFRIHLIEEERFNTCNLL